MRRKPTRFSGGLLTYLTLIAHPAALLLQNILQMADRWEMAQMLPYFLRLLLP
jgi:hypothetical protein